ncbi:MAG TPA: hypothetical protein V6C97_32410 [Oculatellaceae cyanobacterium]
MQEPAAIVRQNQIGRRVSPKLVKSGRLSAPHSYVDLLHFVMSAESVELGILHISSKSLQGDIVISSCISMPGASTSTGLTGWDAIRALLSLKSAVYQYHDFSDADIGGLDQGLTIKLARVVAMMPDLPANVEDLSSRSSLNKMRAMNAERLAADEAAQKVVSSYLIQEVQRFEERSMRFRAAILWSFFVLMVLAAIGIHGLHL